MSEEPNKNKSEFSSTVAIIGGMGIGVMLFFGVVVFVVLFQQRVPSYSLQASHPLLDAYLAQGARTESQPAPTPSDAPKAVNAFLSMNELRPSYLGEG